MKIVIVGGVAGGASAATRARRLDEHADIVLFQRGPDVSFANCGMPFYIGGEIRDRNALAIQTPESLQKRFRLDVRVQTEVVHIDTHEKHVQVRNNITAEVYTETYDQLVLAVGAAPVLPPIIGIKECPCLFTLRNLQDMDRIHAFLKSSTPKNAVVIGAGFVGLEMVEQLVGKGLAVTVVERDAQIMANLDAEMASYLQDILEKHAVQVITGDSVAKLAPSNHHDVEATDITLQSGRRLQHCDLIILGVGVRPDTEVVVAAGTIQCSDRGHVLVDDYLHTTAEHVWAVGDAVQVRNPLLPYWWTVPLAGPANRQGRLVADNILGKRKPYKGTFGVAVLRLFDQYAACVGMNEKQLAQNKGLLEEGSNIAVIHIHPNNHAGYYPQAVSLHLKVIFDKTSGKIFGAQAVGGEGVDKRIDVIATAMQGGMTMNDLAELELCYAPPVGSAKDPVNYAGMVAQNIMEGLVDQTEWHDLEERLSHDPSTRFLDVRNPGEISKTGALVADTVNIPLDALRERLGELDKNARWIVSCASGQRAYYACRILMQNGFARVSNLGGAYQTFHSIHPGAVTTAATEEDTT